MVNVTAVAGAGNVLLKAFGSLCDMSIVDSFGLLVLLLSFFIEVTISPYLLIYTFVEIIQKGPW